ncbi:hypothetical protein PF050_10275 [Kosakonia pseudosacchari]|uniref:hypothetical protein n=1 Tax=Kosakonia pseudosacchari TaxID=1646340 RepID=UPI0022F06C48|nr:hypothetical protein [Kosakonia pseudosacchari]WBU51272.1 hypothetical protein PF050_10275 [Kosakonia pseudosacchari]
MRRIFPVFALLFGFSAQASPTPLTENDFTAEINNQAITLGQEWDRHLMAALGKQASEDFVGEVPFGDENYKFYRHNYAGFDIYSANIDWQQRGKSIDSYVIGQITLHSPALHTARGVAPGDAKQRVIEHYGAGEVDTSDGQQWIMYSLERKNIAFDVTGGSVQAINISVGND